MYTKSLRISALTGLAAVALTAGSFAMPTKAQAIEPVTGAIIGGAVAGAVVGGAVTAHDHDRTVYSTPRTYYRTPSTTTYSYEVDDVQTCYYRTARVYDQSEGDYDYQRVRVCQ
jgi:hypothetical protein